jgi:hypothetical protein
MSKLVEYSRDLLFLCATVFMVLTIVVGFVQQYRRKDDFDLPVYVLGPIMWLGAIIALAVFAFVIFATLVPIVHWLVR